MKLSNELEHEAFIYGMTYHTNIIIDRGGDTVWRSLRLAPIRMLAKLELLTMYEQSIYGHYWDVCKIRTYRINDVWTMYMYSLTANQLTSVGLAQACLINNIKWLISQFHHIQQPKNITRRLTWPTDTCTNTDRQTDRQTYICTHHSLITHMVEVLCSIVPDHKHTTARHTADPLQLFSHFTFPTLATYTWATNKLYKYNVHVTYSHTFKLTILHVWTHLLNSIVKWYN